MILRLKRLEATDHGVFGHLSIDDNSFECVTLERHDIDIPVGNYIITLYVSPEHGLVPLLHDVPGRSSIEMHEGNFEMNSKGCILVGRNRMLIDGKDGISQSRDTIKLLAQQILESHEAVSIEIS